MDDSFLSISPLEPSEVGLLHELVCELADYEKLAHAVSATEMDLHEALFGESPVLKAIIARERGDAIGFATFYTTFSTFAGKRGLYVEDLYVRESARGHGVGRALMAHMADTALRSHCDRMAWAVLEWNQPAHAFYHALDGAAIADWKLYGLSGASLAKLGSASR